MALADTFKQILDSLPDDWAFMDIDVRIFDETRYIEAATYMVQVNPQPTPSTTGTGTSTSRTATATAPRPRRCTGRSRCSTRRASQGELKVRNVRVGRAEVEPMWGRPESVRQEFRKIRAQ
jgi:hypothetical protein